MAEKTEVVVVTKEPPKEQKNPFSFFPGIGFKFPFQFPRKESKPEGADGGATRAKTDVVVAAVGGSEESDKPDVVRFPYQQLEVAPPPPLKLEVEPESGKTSNPVILWQVYALGGFLILKWVWGRWQERKARKGSDDQATTGGHDSAADDSTLH